MKIILLILITININLFSQTEEFDIMSKYYNISNNVLYSLVISDNEYIFYGDNGGILRTYDGGTTWEQEFIGTHNFIFDIKFIEGNLYGVTSGGEYIFSTDKGENWKIKKVNNDVISQITKFKNMIFIISNSNKLLFSENNGEDWNELYTFNGSVENLEFIDTSLFVKIQNNNIHKLLKSSNSGLDWEEIELPNIDFNSNFKLKKINNQIIAFNDSSFAELNLDLSWNYYNTKKSVIFDLVKINDNYHFFNYQSDSLEFYDKIYSTSQNSFIDSNIFSKLGMMPGDYRILSTSSDSENILITSYNKTIIKIENSGKSPKVLSCFSKYGPNFPIFYDKNNWYYSSSLDENGVGGNIIKSTNNGKTFNLSNYFFIDTLSEGYTFYGLPHLTTINKDTILINVSVYQQSTNNFRPNNQFISYNSGNSVEPLPQVSEISAGHVRKMFRLKDNNFLITKINQLDEKQEFYFMNSNYKVDSLSELNEIHNLNTVDILTDKDTVWLYGYSSKRNNKHFIYKSIDTCKTWDLVFEGTFEGYSSVFTFCKGKNGKYYLFVGNQDVKIVEFDVLDGSNQYNYIYDSFDFNDNKLYRFFQTSDYFYKNEIKYLEDINFLHGFAVNENNQLKGYFKEVKLEIENKNIKVDTFRFFDKKYVKINTINDDFGIYYLNNSNIFIPIEDTTLVHSSVEKPIPPAIWTYPPFPNPVKDILKMKFYSSMMGEIAKLKVELIEIGSGRSYKINDYEISKSSDYWGEIIIDVGNFQTGAYLINFKLGNSNKSESIIIE